MIAKEAVARRILALCNEKEIVVNALANSAGISPSPFTACSIPKARIRES